MSAVVLLSGGVDSTTALAVTLENGIAVAECLTVNYGQRHAREIASASAVADHYGVKHLILDMPPALFSGSSSALTGGADLPHGHAESPDETYVPARNTVLIALAAARAESIGAGIIVIGANADDAAGYPDCRWEYIEAYRDVLLRGTLQHVWIYTPLMYFNKSDVLHAAQTLDAPIGLTWSCYAGADSPCGECGACESLAGVR